MHPFRVFLILFTASLFAVVPAKAAPRHSTKHRAIHHPRSAQRPPRGSFTSLRVESLAELQAQVRHDPVVRRRYARFFHLSENQVASFVDHDLYSMRVPKTTHCVVYFVSPKGHFYTHPLTLKPGARVFALRRTGQPALNFVCGNGFLIPIKLGYIPVRDIQVSTNIQATVPTDRAPVYDFFGPSFGAVPVSTALNHYHSGGNLFPLAAFALLGVHGGHSTPPSPTPSVPEPGAVLFLFAGLPVIGWAVRRRKA